MRFQVPQFVDIEDRVIGPLTLKMFGYYAVAGMLLVPLYVLLDLGAFVTFALPVLGLAALFAHVRIQGQPLVTVVWYATTFYTSPRIYLWGRGGKSYQMIIRGPEYDEFLVDGTGAPTLSALADMLNTQGNVSAQDEADPLLDDAEPSESGDQTPAP